MSKKLQQPTNSDGDIPSEQEIKSCKKIAQLVKWCEYECVDVEDCENAKDAQRRLLQHRERLKNYTTQSFSAPITVAQSVLQAFAVRRNELEQLVNDIAKYVYLSKAFSCFEELEMTEDNDKNDWMSKTALESVGKDCSKKPKILIAGCTSAGKTTLLNVLLGESILPMAHNAATSMLCEVRYGEKKRAFAQYLDGNGKTITNELDLTTEEGQEKLRCIAACRETNSSSRRPVASASKEDTGRSKADNAGWSQLEISWPMEFLKYVTLIDSPGVTDSNETKSVTEKCQREDACGYIYVIDASRAQEEGWKAGGLMQVLQEQVQYSVPPDSILFVVNKWDAVPEAERECSLNIITTNLENLWPMFKSHQLLTLSSTEAAKFWRFRRELTPSLEAVCKAITNMIPGSLNNVIANHLNKLCKFIESIESTLQTIIGQLKLPVAKRTKIHKDSWDSLKQVRTLLEKMTTKIYGKVQTLQDGLTLHLQSKEVCKSFHSWDLKSLPAEQKAAVAAENVQLFLDVKLGQIVESYESQHNLQQWARKKLEEQVKAAQEILSKANVDLSGSNAPTSNKRSTSSYEVETLLDLMRPIGEFMGPNGALFFLTRSLMAKKSESASGIASKVVLFPLAAVGDAVSATVLVPVGAALAAVYTSLKYLISQIGKVKTFKKNVEKAYGDFIMDESKVFQQLHDMVLALLKINCELVQAVLDTLPSECDKLEKQLVANEKSEEKNIPTYKELLRECQDLKVRLSIMRLQCMVRIFTSTDISWPQPNAAIGIGSFGEVYKVNIPEAGDVALKLRTVDITQQTTSDLTEEIDISRKCKHENIVKFIGLVNLSSNPVKIGLLYQWCERGTLDSLIKDAKEEPAYTLNGFSTAKSLALDMLRGIEYLHYKGIIHRDLKPENVLITVQRKALLADMGLEKSIEQVKGTSRRTLWYMAPEVFREKPNTKQVDIFSFGIIMWEVWNKQRVDEVPKTLSLQRFLELVETGQLRPGNGQFIGEKNLFEKPQAFPISESYLQQQPLSLRVSQDNAETWADVAKACWSSHPEFRPSATTTYENISTIAD